MRRAPEIVGWREWVALPDLGIGSIKAKVDTGARSSALHAFDVELFHRNGRWLVRFKVHPRQRDTTTVISAEAPLADQRIVRTSSGHEHFRPVIQTLVGWRDLRWPIEVTLASRDVMGFRMLLGRQAIRARCLVDPARSFLGGLPMKRAPSRKKRRSP